MGSEGSTESFLASVCPTKWQKYAPFGTSLTVDIPMSQKLTLVWALHKKPSPSRKSVKISDEYPLTTYTVYTKDTRVNDLD